MAAKDLTAYKLVAITASSSVLDPQPVALYASVDTTADVEYKDGATETIPLVVGYHPISGVVKLTSGTGVFSCIDA